MTTIRLFVFALFVVLSALAPEAGARVSVRAAVAKSFAPADLHLFIRIEPDADNRSLQVSIESRDYYRSSLFQLDAERAARVMTLEYRAVPAGEYEIVGVVRDSRGQERGRARTSAYVIASAGER